MKPDIDYIKKEESDQLEFKEDFNDSALKTICAFANTKGGTLVIGINSKKKYVGVEMNDEKLQSITHKIVNKIGIMPDIEIKEVEKKNIIEINVQKSSIPVSYEGRYYKIGQPKNFSNCILLYPETQPYFIFSTLQA